MTFIIGRAGSNPSLLNASKGVVQRNFFNGNVIKRNYSNYGDLFFPARIQPQTTFTKIHTWIIISSVGALGCYGAFEGVKAGSKDARTIGEAMVIGTAGGIMLGSVYAAFGWIGGAVFPFPIGAAIYWSLNRRSHT